MGFNAEIPYKVRRCCHNGLRSDGLCVCLLGTPALGPCFPEVFPQLDEGEFKSERRYISSWLAVALAQFERLWYGGMSPD